MGVLSAGRKYFNCDYFIFDMILSIKKNKINPKRFIRSPALPVLSSENSPILSGPLSSEEISWISSINCFGGLTGSLLCGYVIPLIGSKRTLLLTSIPSAIYWIMIYFGITFYHIFAARFISGIAGGVMHSSGMLYISEIANDEYVIEIIILQHILIKII